jgi:polar amino acid transport system permease protein
VITLQDIMFIATRANAVTKEPFLFFGAAMMLYFAFSLLSSAVFGRMERNANKGFAPATGGVR